MVIKYRLVNWEFNKGAWSQAVATAVDEVGVDIVAHMMDVVPSTVKNWAMMYQSSYGEFPYPNMTNFLKFCNQFDCDVRDFWYLEDV